MRNEVRIYKILLKIFNVSGTGPVEDIGVDFTFLCNNAIIGSWRKKILGTRNIFQCGVCFPDTRSLACD